jgi:protein-disulfide isomerase
MLRRLIAVLCISFSSATWAIDLTPEQKKLVEIEVEKNLEGFFESEKFQAVIDQAIVDFINRQNQDRSQAKEAEVEQQALTILPITQQDYVYGPEDARFTLIEYSDFECPYCKKFHLTAEQFVDQNENVNWVYRHFPLNFHNPGAQKQAEAAECAGELAGNRGFWEYSSAIFKRTRSNGNGFPISNLTPLAIELGLDEDEFSECLNSSRYRYKVLAQFKQGQQAGVTGTPGNFLVDTQTNRIIPVHGAQPLSALEQKLNQLLEN